MGIITLATVALAPAGILENSDKEGARPVVEAVFVLDTTGSMGGLIAGAKEKIWSIANSLATAKPVPVIKIGLIAYRDKGDQYVTQITPMTSDLDAVYSKLMEFQAGGGGDTPESVNQGLNDAVTRIEWSADKNTYKVVFLVGDCPPHMDYEDDVKYPEICGIAVGKGIVINTVLCGGNPSAMKIWKDIAVQAEGAFFQVAQDGNAVVIETPQDGELAKLAAELDSTRIFYGSESDRSQSAQREVVAGKLMQSSSISARAQRAVFNGSKAGADNFVRGKELVSEYNGDQKIIAEISAKELPKELAGMDQRQLAAHVERLSKKRKALQKQIRDLSGQRQAFIQREMAKVKGKKEKSLEYNVYQTIKEQTADKSVTYDAEDAVY